MSYFHFDDDVPLYSTLYLKLIHKGRYLLVMEVPLTQGSLCFIVPYLIARLNHIKNAVLSYHRCVQIFSGYKLSPGS